MITTRDAAAEQSPAFSLMRFSLALILLWFGAMKFQPYEAEGVSHIAEHYWLFGWLYPLVGVAGASAVIGALEITAGLLVAVGARSALASALGGAMSVAVFLVTLSFLATAPHVFKEGYGAPWLGSTGQFLIKDVALLAISVGVLLEGLNGLRRGGLLGR